MSKFAIIRLGKDSIPDIKTIDALHGSPETPVTFSIHCAQVPKELEVGDFAFFCLGSDNNKGIATEWARGVRALGSVTSKSGGPGYNDQWEVDVEIKVILPASINQKDLLAKSPAAYFWCSSLPVLGVDTHSNQTVQLIKEGDDNQDVRALVYALDAISGSFAKDTKEKYPELSVLFDYSPPATSGPSAPAQGGQSSRAAENVIFFGPPGTGKSTSVQGRVISAPMFRTQFHPEFSHTDLIGSYRPVVGTETSESERILGFDGIPTARPVNYFSFVPGPLALSMAKAFSSDEHVYLVIEEINRGDCAAIFGDAFQLLDRNDSGRSEFGITAKPELIDYFKANGAEFDIAKDGKLYLPENLSILATMNTSDQSLYPMDAAFKRRWQWIACPIDFDELLSYTVGARPHIDDGQQKWDWICLLKNINRNIIRDRMEDKQLGPWFIKPAKDGLVSWNAFLNKCLFYLWHDVFKDEQLSVLSPFKADGPEVFGDVQVNIRDNGLAAGLKPELLVPLADAVVPETGEGVKFPLSPQESD